MQSRAPPLHCGTEQRATVPGARTTRELPVAPTTPPGTRQSATACASSTSIGRVKPAAPLTRFLTGRPMRAPAGPVSTGPARSAALTMRSERAEGFAPAGQASIGPARLAARTMRRTAHPLACACAAPRSIGPAKPAAPTTPPGCPLGTPGAVTAFATAGLRGHRRPLHVWAWLLRQHVPLLCNERALSCVDHHGTSLAQDLEKKPHGQMLVLPTPF
jgi:hypothetical protein